MRIGFAAPIHLPGLGGWLDAGSTQIQTYSFPYMSELVNAYLERGHEVDVYSYKLSSRDPSTLGHGPLRVFLANRRSQPKFRALDRFLQERRALTRAIASSRPDVIHAHWTYEFAAAALSSGHPTLVTAHDSPTALRKNFGGFYWNRRASLGQEVLRRVSRLSAVSPELLDELLADSPSLEGKSRVIPNGIAQSSISADAPGAVRSFVTIANGFDDRKNTKTVIEAFALLQKERPEVSLTLYGAEHGEGEKAWHWAQKNQMTRSVRFAGLVAPPILKQELSRVPQCLVHGSLWEACSMAILEALALGMPVIGGKHSGGVGFTLGYGSSGLLVDVTSPVEIAGAMQRILDYPELVKNLQKTGLHTVRGQFALDSVVNAYVDELSILRSTANDRG